MGNIKLTVVAIAVVVMSVVGSVAATAVTRPSTTTVASSPDNTPGKLLSELRGRGVMAEYSEEYSKPHVVPQGRVVITGNLTASNLGLSVRLYESPWLAESECQPIQATCVSFGSWVIRPGSPDGMTATDSATWTAIRQKLQ